LSSPATGKVWRYVRRPWALSVLWEGDSLDWKDLSAEDIYTRVTSGVEPGSIILFHNAAKNTPDALADIIEYLLAEGYEIVPVSQLLLTGSYEIDHTGEMYASETA
jgi:peptidoglycan/xylan/chitin deacetylase (PgdA/CDA1 family)